MAIFLAAVVGGVVHTKSLPLRHLVEGMFTYFDICLIFITATLFINLLKRAGGIAFVVREIVRAFHRRRALCLALLTLVLLIPGALTGSGAVTVFTTGTLVGTVLTYMGIDKTRSTATIFLCAAMSAAAPPINLWAMMAAVRTSLCWVYATAIGSVSERALLAMFILGRKGEAVKIEEAVAALPEPPKAWLEVILPLTFFGLMVASIWPS